MDSLIIYLFIGLAGAATFLLMGGRAIGWKNVAKHSIKFDLVASFIIFSFFAGTSTDGIIGSTIAALAITIFTTCFRQYWIVMSRRGLLSPLGDPTVDWKKAKEYARDVVADVMAPV